MIHVGLVDYHAGNLRSIATAFEYLGARTQIIREHENISHLTHIVLPGVGAFEFCFENLRGSGMLPMLEEWTFTMQKPILGICVGMQLLADSSDEMGFHSGLGWIGGQVKKIYSDNPSIRIPHVGWNTVCFEQDFGGYHKNTSREFYFDHSHAYYLPNKNLVLATAKHGQEFCAAIKQNNIVAVQFHPEKSQAAGLKFLQNFLYL